jgi:hypothetical protein
MLIVLGTTIHCLLGREPLLKELFGKDELQRVAIERNELIGQLLQEKKAKC